MGNLNCVQPPQSPQPPHPQRPNRKWRMLCLHGYKTNKQLMELQLMCFDEKYTQKIEFVSMNAPIEATDAYSEEIGRACPPPYHLWYSLEPADKMSDLIPHLNKAKEEGAQLQEDVALALRHIDAFIDKNGPFDGVLGFSQGGAMSLLAAAQASWCRVAVLVCPAMPPAQLDAAREIARNPIQGCSLLLVTGRTDHPRCRRVQDLFNVFDPSATRVHLEHAGGHTFPHLVSERPLYDELAQKLAEALERTKPHPKTGSPVCEASGNAAACPSIEEIYDVAERKQCMVS